MGYAKKTGKGGHNGKAAKGKNQMPAQMMGGKGNRKKAK